MKSEKENGENERTVFELRNKLKTMDSQESSISEKNEEPTESATKLTHRISYANIVRGKKL